MLISPLLDWGFPVIKLVILTPELLRHHLETYHLFQSDKFSNTIENHVIIIAV